MHLPSAPGVRWALLLLFLGCQASAPALSPLSLAAFDRKAAAQQPVCVVFLGGSLTWGANASDPQATSYRGLMMEYLRDRYPGTPIAFHDAAIGGTGSNLGLFRLDRDVLPHKPDLVLLDFTVNDDDSPACLASYEHIVRELLSSGSMVMPVLMSFKWHVAKPDDPLPSLHLQHLALAEAYRLPAADTTAALRAQVKGGLNPDSIWNIGGDGSHPGDEGYRLLFETVRDRFERALAEKDDAVIPSRTIFADLYPKRARQTLVESSLPPGWTRKKTYRTAMWFDGLSSRWMGDVAVTTPAANAAPLEVRFYGSLVGLFGERNASTPPIKVWIDGAPVRRPKAPEGDDRWLLDSNRIGGGNLMLWLPLAKDLPDGQHTLRIEPVWDGAAPGAELRIESVCSAGH